MNQIDLNGQHAVVTGGAQGLGLAFARRLIASGARVTLWDLDEKRLEAALAELGDSARRASPSTSPTMHAVEVGARLDRGGGRAGLDPRQFRGHRRAERHARRI